MKNFVAKYKSKPAKPNGSMLHKTIAFSEYPVDSYAFISGSFELVISTTS